MLSISYLTAKIRNNSCNSVAKIHHNAQTIINKCFYFLNIVYSGKKILPTSKQI